MTDPRAMPFLRSAIALALSVALLCVFIFAAAPTQTRAQTGTTLGGYLWSDTIGWISMSGAGYGITIDASGNLSGYAWSENIGWVSAQSSDVVGCPAGTCAPKISGGTSSGWLRVLAATGNGWDGWISLSCSNGGTCATVNYGPTNTGGVYAGYAWGSDVVGWLSFANVLPPAPTCSILPATQTIVRGSNASLTWSSTNATSGTITAIGNVGASGSGAVNPTATTTYNGTFGGGGGYGSCQATVNVQCAPIYSCSGQTIQYTNSGCTTVSVTTCVSPSYCTSGQSACTVPPPSFTASGSGNSALTGHLQARPELIHTGSSTRLFWNVSNVQSCTVSGSNGNTLNAGCASNTCTSGASGQTTATLTSGASYTLTCTTLSGATPASFSESVNVIPTPTFHED